MLIVDFLGWRMLHFPLDATGIPPTIAAGLSLQGSPRLGLPRAVGPIGGGVPYAYGLVLLPPPEYPKLSPINGKRRSTRIAFRERAERRHTRRDWVPEARKVRDAYEQETR